jgi:hypothetical protein
MQDRSVELVRQARAAIWRLFDAELLDEELATVALLAITVGHRRYKASRTDETSRPDQGAQRPPS